jgi:hypothetical protein
MVWQEATRNKAPKTNIGANKPLIISTAPIRRRDFRHFSANIPFSPKQIFHE